MCLSEAGWADDHGGEARSCSGRRPGPDRESSAGADQSGIGPGTIGQHGGHMEKRRNDATISS